MVVVVALVKVVEMEATVQVAVEQEAILEGLPAMVAAGGVAG